MLATITALLTAHRIPAVFLGAFFFGDSVIFTASFLTGQLSWPVLPIFATAFLGTAFADTMWYFVGVFASRRLSSTQFMRAQREKAAALMAKLTGEKPAYALIFIKFLYGSRIAMILYVAARGLSFRTFSMFNSIGIFVWLLIFFPIGYYAGKGISSNFPILNVIEATVIVFAVSFIALRVFSLWLTKTVTNE